MNFEKIRKEIGDFTNYYINVKDLKNIFKNHPYFGTGSDLKKVWMNSCEFGLDRFPQMIEAMIKWPEQNFNSIRYGQCRAKQFLINQLVSFMNFTDRILICGSWHGVTSMILEYQGYTQWFNIDTDLEACDVTKHFGIHTYPYDMFNIDMSGFDVIINTSCEHIDLKSWLKLIPEGKLIGLQSTNLPYKNHVNIVKDAKDFQNITESVISRIQPVKYIEFTGPEPEMKKYKRFTLIGTT